MNRRQAILASIGAAIAAWIPFRRQTATASGQITIKWSKFNIAIQHGVATSGISESSGGVLKCDNGLSLYASSDWDVQPGAKCTVLRFKEPGCKWRVINATYDPVAAT